MSNPEIEYNPSGDKDNIILKMADMLEGRDGTINVSSAKVLFIQQHKRTKGGLTGQDIRVLAQNEPSIQYSSRLFKKALFENNFGIALNKLNLLYIYGEADFNDSLGGKAFATSLEAHRLFAKLILDELIDEDSGLYHDKNDILVKLVHHRDQQSSTEEMQVLRKVIHYTALYGELGKEAKRGCDPFAILDRSYFDT